MKPCLITFVTVLFAAALAPAQKLDLKLDSVAAAAAEKAEVDLDESQLGLGKKFAGGAVPKPLQGALSGVKEIHVRSYEFEKPGAYSDRDLEGIRKQVGAGSGWSRIVNVKEDNETTEIYMYSDGGKPAGFLLINAEPKELTVVHVQGTIQLAQLQELVQSSVQFDLKNLPAGAKAQ